MFPVLAALLVLAGADSSAVPADSLPREVRRTFPAIEVSAGRVHDLRSSASVHTVSAEAIRDLPVSSLSQVLALQPGVVAVGEDLHVRGGRAGETQWVLAGLTLNEPLRDRAPLVPLLAVRHADLLAGGQDAEYAGSLAGVIDLRTWDPAPEPRGALRWITSARAGNAYDWVGARGSLPLLATGLGVVGAVEVRLDDQDTPGRSHRARASVLGRRFGWRNDNQLSAWAKLAPIAKPQSLALEVLGSRVVSQPYDPMFAFDDSLWIRFLDIPCELCPPVVDSFRTFYRGADHQPMTETRRGTATLSAAGLGGQFQWRAAASWQHATELTSPGLTRDPRNLFDTQKVRFGLDVDPDQSPLLAVLGDVPYYRRARGDRFQLGGSLAWQPTKRDRVETGAGYSHDWTESYELDSAIPTSPLIDSLRTYHTSAPGAWAYVQHRGDYEGLVWNTGLRAQMFSAGDARARVGVDPFTGAVAPDQVAPGALWTLSPRIGLAMPLSVRDAFSASYARIHQNPGRDYLADDRLLIYSRRPLGTPTLEPSELVTYQIGLKHLFNERWAVQGSLFHRDLFGQVGVVNDPYFVGTYRPRYANSEYGHATGYEVALLAGPRSEPQATGSFLRRFLAGEFSLRWTQMNADGTLSGTDGWYYGAPFGFRPIAIGEHPLDWDRGSMFEMDGVWREPHVFTFALVVQVSGGARWTPTNDTLTSTGGPPGTSPNLKAVNARQLPAMARTDFSLRLEPRALRGARVLLEVKNVFDAKGEAAASMPGYPHPSINTERDDYAGHRTLTGRGGAAFWDPRLNGGRGGWVEFDDPRLRLPRRSIRLGFEVGM